MSSLNFPVTRSRRSAALLPSLPSSPVAAVAYDPCYSARAARFSTSAPLTSTRKRTRISWPMRCRSPICIYFPRPAAPNIAIHGIDVSKYQGNIDWEAGQGLGRRLRLYQGDRGRRRRGLEVPAQLGRRQGRRDSARRLSFRLLVPPAARGNRQFRERRAGGGGRSAAGSGRRGDAEPPEPASARSTARK